MIQPFQIANQPQLHFGWGIRHQFEAELIAQKHAHLVIISSQFLTRPGNFSANLVEKLQQNGTRVQLFSVSGEPSPDLVDALVSSSSQQAEAVIGIGGGSVLDAAKAIAGLIPCQRSVMDFLEGVGKGLAFDVETLPFIALPTTAGTGSETTKNAVLSRLGEFKKSFRSDKLLAKTVWLDPEFLQTCPKDILYSTGLDAFTQLLESYTTLKANPLTDALAWEGMTLFKGAFEMIDSEDAEAQKTGYGHLMLAANFSGTTLANSGLGAVHGLAGPIGAFFEAPHGSVCANLLAPITRMNIESLKKDHSHFAKTTLAKYAQVGQLLTAEKSNETAQLNALIEKLKLLALTYAPKPLSDFGITQNTLSPIIQSCRAGSMLGNPVFLSDEQLISALSQ